MTSVLDDSKTTETVDFDAMVDAFIKNQLPDWLKRASSGQINRLRDRFKLNLASQNKVRAATVDLIPIHAFALQHFSALLATRLPENARLDQLQWLDVRREFGRIPGVHWPFYRPHVVRQHGLLTLMQNFHADDAVLEGSGLVYPGSDTVLSGSSAALARDCRNKDVGGLYQALLDEVFTATNRRLLAEEKRANLELVIEMSVLKGLISAQEQLALHQIAQGSLDEHDDFLRGYPGVLTVLGHTVSDAMVVTLRNKQGQDKGLILYLPSDPEQPLRRYDSWAALQLALVADLKRVTYCDYFITLIALAQRADFVQTIGKRLADDVTDLALEGITAKGNIFDDLVMQQVERMKSDARWLLVPTADADQKAAASRHRAWELIGGTLLGLSGLFMPTVGAMLFGSLVIQTLSELFEGAVDWSRGHQHEALEHLLGVAETVAVNLALAGGAKVVARGFSRSTFVDSLEPIKLDNGDLKLWCNDLDAYATTPLQPRLQPDGLYGTGDIRWLRVAQQYFGVGKDSAPGVWRLRHPLRSSAYGPALERLGERGWRIRTQRPQTWTDQALMLHSLWPQEPALTQAEAAQVLAIADMDTDELRGLLVDNRSLPANLRETLRRFAADRRVSAFFDALNKDLLPVEDEQIQLWCLAQPGFAELDEKELRASLLAQASTLRVRLFNHLSHVALPADPMRALVQRDFTGLPDAYAEQLLQTVSSQLRSIAIAESRVPLTVASDARSLLQLARLNRAVEGLYLDNACSDEAGSLILALLAELPEWPVGLHLTLREGASDGRIVKTLGTPSLNARQFTLVSKDGQFTAYNSAGQLLTLRPGMRSCSLIEVVADLLSADDRTALNITDADAHTALRTLIQARLPASRGERIRLLGWAQRERWFNPGRRMADGRVGYVLSGRGQVVSRWETTRRRLSAIFPSLSEDQLDARLSQMLLAPDTLYQRLAELEHDWEQLQRALARWTAAGLQGSSDAVRNLTAERIRQAWQQQGEHIAGAVADSVQQQLTLSGLHLHSLPEFPLSVDFPHVTTLIISDTSLTHLPVDFLHSFTALRELNLSGNRLLALPRGIAYLSDLRRLRLARNAIRLDRAGVEVLTSLRHLTHLDLSYNPLGAVILRFNHIPQLLEVNLRNCRLGAWPDGLEHCVALERADLRNNQIAVVPAAILGMPNVFRGSFLVEHNHLSSSELRALYALDTIQEHLHELQRLVPMGASTVQDRWLNTVAETSRNARLYQWETLEAMPNSRGFFRLLGWLTMTPDHGQVPDRQSTRVWSLLDALMTDAQLRERIYELANDSLTCLNAVDESFSDLQRRAAIAGAQANTLHERGNDLITLGQGLFRLDRLDVFARQDIRNRLEARESVDQSAVRLYYRVQLRGRLSLPFQPRAMSYPEAAQVSPAQIEQALTTVRNAESIEALGESLSQQPFWRSYLIERHDAVFDAIETAHQARFGALQARAAQLSEQELELQTEVLQSQREVETLDAIRGLTWQILYGRERGLA